MRLQWTLGLVLAVPGLAATAPAATPYTVSQKVVEGHATYHLTDSARHQDLGIVPDMGNFVYEFRSNGKDVLIPPPSFAAYLEKHWFCCGIPFLEPWANRIDQDYYYFEGKKYLLNDDLGTLLRLPDTHLIIHGLVVFDRRWKVVETGASDADGAFVTSQLDFWKYPDLMAQFPFAHTIEITYRLKDGKLENTTEIHNLSAAAMPVDFGYHPYFHPDGPREDWTVSIGAKLHWIVDNYTHLVPTGETERADKFLPQASEFKLDKTFLDDGFSSLVRDARGLGHYWVKGKAEKIELVFGKEYNFGHVYAPLDNTLICLEPETAVTNAFNLNHDGKFPSLIVLQPGKIFRARFWIVPTGF